MQRQVTEGIIPELQERKRLISVPAAHLVTKTAVDGCRCLKQKIKINETDCQRHKGYSREGIVIIYRSEEQIGFVG